MTKPVPFLTAVARGFAMKCPHCGQGALFDRFLKVTGHCRSCSEDFTAQQADDFPAYLVIVVIGHLVVPALLAVEVAYSPPAWLQLAIWLPVTLFGALGLLQPTKGAIVGLQWQIGMHGFDISKQHRARESLQR